MSIILHPHTNSIWVWNKVRRDLKFYIFNLCIGKYFDSYQMKLLRSWKYDTSVG